VVISATKQEGYVLTKSQRTTEETVLMFDLSIPRSLDPTLAKMSGVILLNIEDLISLFEEKKRVYRQELYACEKAIERSVKAYTRLYRDKQINKAFYLSCDVVRGIGAL
jgi:glutamyl-tRNA reductase